MPRAERKDCSVAVKILVAVSRKLYRVKFGRAGGGQGSRHLRPRLVVLPRSNNLSAEVGPSARVANIDSLMWQGPGRWCEDTDKIGQSHAGPHMEIIIVWVEDQLVPL